MPNRPLWIIAVLLIAVAGLLGLIASEIGKAASEIRLQGLRRPALLSRKPPFSACPKSNPPHPMGASCKGNGNNCDLDIDSFKNPVGGVDHDSDPACAVWVSFTQGSSVTITDKGPSAAPFTVSFSLELDSQLDPNCSAIKYANPFTDDPTLKSASLPGGSGYSLVMKSMKPTAIDCHFKMHLQQGSATYDPHIYGDM